MNEFVLLVLANTLGILLSAGISMVVLFKLMNYPKFVKWIVNWYMKYMEKTMETMEKVFDDEED